MSYPSLYDDYWSRAENVGTSSFTDGHDLALTLLRTCSMGKVLDVGCGMGVLMRHLSGIGIEVAGVDVSSVAVNHCDRFLPGCVKQGSVLSLPFEDEGFGTVVSTDCLDHLLPAEVEPALQELYRVCSDSLFLTITTRSEVENPWRHTTENREWWENKLFEAGFRRSETFLEAAPYPALNQDPGIFTFVGRKIPPLNLTRFPLSALREERQEHMDMTRESSSRSDAHLVRYQWASRSVQRGDRVLDAACGYGYGASMIAHLSAASEVHGIDLSEGAISYAREMFASSTERLRFDVGSLPEDLQKLPDGRYDLIVSFETLEHLEDVEGFLGECERLLTPGGRLVCSVPNDWTDEHGSDPNPYHLHVFTWPKLRELLGRNFLIDQSVAQTADRAKVNGVWERQGRQMRVFSSTSDALEVPAEWLYTVSIKLFAGGGVVPFTDRRFGCWEETELPGPIDFAASYENPWISRVLLSAGHQPSTKELLADLGRDIEARASLPADQAAGLIVQMYQVVTDGSRTADVCAELIQRAVFWLDQDHSLEGNPSAQRQNIRWRVSLWFAVGLLYQHVGDRPAAVRAFVACTEEDAMSFSPVLCTKTTEAYLRLAFIRFTEGDTVATALYLQQLMDTADEAFSAPHSSQRDDHGLTPPYYWKELGAIARTAEWASLLAYRLQNGALTCRDFAPYWTESLIAQDNPLPESPIRWQKGPARILQGNPWCKLLSATGCIRAVLHPSNTSDEDQPRLEIPLEKRAGTCSFHCTAQAGNPHPENQGVRLLVEAVLEHESLLLQEVHVPPREEISFSFESPLVTEYCLVISIFSNTGAETFTYRGTHFTLESS